jgi:hypothetical protein
MNTRILIIGVAALLMATSAEGATNPQPAFSVATT